MVEETTGVVVVEETTGVVVVGVVGPASSAVIRLVMTEAGGLAIVVLAGTKAIVMSCPFSKRSFCGSPGVSAPCFAVKFGQL